MPSTIRKEPERIRMAALPDPDAKRKSFTWDEAARLLDGLPNGGLNIAFEALDRHVASGHGAQVALRWLGKNGERVEVSYADLAQRAARFANVLAAHGLVRGDSVFALMGRVPDLYVAALGTLKAGLVFTPLFSAFGPEPIRTRMEIGAAKVLVTTEALYRRKIAAWRDEIPTLKLVLIVGETAPEGCVALDPAMEAARPDFVVAETRPEDPALIHFTSGTTGKPKGAVHVHKAVIYHAVSGRYALELTPGTIYWCTADPGWVTGTSYGIISPLVNRVTMIVDEAEFDLERWYETIERERVEVWYSAPTAIRMMMRAGAEAAAPYDFSSLRFLASVGEPLNPEAVAWSNATFGMPFHDNWWQTETGGIMIANLAAEDVHPGSMGKPMPGITAGIVKRAASGVEELGAGQIGELALRPGWPSMMRTYLHEQARYDKCFVGGWYLSGDLAMRDPGGRFWFVGRADDLIKTSGHLVGPFEVESALIEHEAVAEAGVIGVPDETAGEVIKAYVTLKPGFEPDAALERSIRGHARKKLGRADDLIKTSGHLVGPFEVESALIEHEAVAEAGVIGVPDETAGEVIKAYVTLKPGFEPDAALERSIRGHARKKLGPAVAPREIVFRKTLPKTRSGKIMRRLLKARELGLPEGDISTLESDET